MLLQKTFLVLITLNFSVFFSVLSLKYLHLHMCCSPKRNIFLRIKKIKQICAALSTSNYLYMHCICEYTTVCVY